MIIWLRQHVPLVAYYQRTIRTSPHAGVRTGSSTWPFTLSLGAMSYRDSLDDRFGRGLHSKEPKKPIDSLPITFCGGAGRLGWTFLPLADDIAHTLGSSRGGGKKTVILPNMLPGAEDFCQSITTVVDCDDEAFRPKEETAEAFSARWKWPGRRCGYRPVRYFPP